jgi:hypothetical protein
MQTLWMWTVDCSEMREGNPTVLTGGSGRIGADFPTPEHNCTQALSIIALDLRACLFIFALYPGRQIMTSFC